MTLIKPRIHTFMDSPCDLNGIPIPRQGDRPPMLIPQILRHEDRIPIPILLTPMHEDSSPIQILPIPTIQKEKKMHWSLTEEWNFLWILLFCCLFFLYMTPVFVYDAYSYYVPEEAYGWRNPYVWFSLFSAFFLPLILMEYVDMEQGKEIPWSFQPLFNDCESLTGIEVVHFCVYLLTICWIVKWTTYVYTLRLLCVCSSFVIFLLHYGITSFLTHRINLIY